jgi:hypothetical protein
MIHKTSERVRRERMKLKPLEQFICDECGGLIKKVEDGWLEWINPPNKPVHGFRIVHNAASSPGVVQAGNCYYPKNVRIFVGIKNA